MTSSYPEIESSTYTAKEHLLFDLEELAINVKVYYDWVGNYGILTMVSGTVRYLNDTTLVYVLPTQPPNRHAKINDRSTSAQREEFNAKNNLLKRDRAVVTS